MSSSLGIAPTNLDPATVDIQSQWKQRKQDWQNLEKALSSGDINSAQQAFASVQKDMESVQVKQGSKQGNKGQQFEQDLQNLQNALSSGDLTAAQKAFSALSQQGATGAHYHHHRQSSSSSEATASSSETVSTTATQVTTSGVNLLV
jgi:hypothetical protein